MSDAFDADVLAAVFLALARHAQRQEELDRYGQDCDWRWIRADPQLELDAITLVWRGRRYRLLVEQASAS